MAVIAAGTPAATFGLARGGGSFTEEDLRGRRTVLTGLGVAAALRYA
jgi:hypothetical protein